MTCTRTGCHIWIEPYNEWAYGDAFEISPFKTRDEHLIERANRFLNEQHTDWRAGLGALVTNIAYFKIVKRSFQPINNLTVKHYTVHNFQELIGGHSDEVEHDYWPPALLITNNFTNHSYSGVPL